MDLWLMGIDGTNYKKEDNLRFSEIEGVDSARNYRRQWYVSGMSGRFQRQPADLPKEPRRRWVLLAPKKTGSSTPTKQFAAGHQGP